MSPTENEPTDYRRYRRQTDRTLFSAVIVFLVVVGGLLIGIIYGRTALVTALVCLFAGAALLSLLWTLLTVLERWLNQDS